MTTPPPSAAEGAATLTEASQPAAGDFLEEYRRLSADHDHIISAHIGSEYSGALSSARAGADLLHRGDPNAAAAHLVDSHTTSGARQRRQSIVVRAFAGRPLRPGVVHAADPEAEAADLPEKLKACLDCRETMVVEFGAVIGTHGGAGALGVSGYPDD